MVSTCGFARLGMLVAGLGVGAVVASTSGIASADTLDFQISIDGYDLLPTADNSAVATSGMGDFAIAFGDGASATANGGFGNFAIAEGSGAVALAGGDNADTVNGGSGDFSIADGINAEAFSGGGMFNSAYDIGNNSGPNEFALAGVGNNDTAFIDAPNSMATSGGDILDPDFTGNNDIALILDPFGAGGDTANVGINVFDPGNYDFGAVLFDDNAVSQGASGADYLYDIVTAFATESNAAAATSAAWLAELLALF